MHNIENVYHGSHWDFSNFKYKYIGRHGNEHGYGIYFTSDLSVAMSYGDYVYKADLIIHDFFSTDVITITKEQLKSYMLKYISEEYLENYSYYDMFNYDKSLTIDKIVDDLFTYNLSDVDILSEILPDIKAKDSDKAYDAIYKIFHKDGVKYVGYSELDGEKITNYIVYSNNQIKNKERVYL